MLFIWKKVDVQKKKENKKRGGEHLKKEKKREQHRVLSTSTCDIVIDSLYSLPVSFDKGWPKDACCGDIDWFAEPWNCKQIYIKITLKEQKQKKVLYFATNANVPT